MDFFEAVERRYSHKEKFLPNTVPVEVLERIVKVGIEAPNGQNKQCVKFIILPDRASLEPLCEVSPTVGLQTAPAAIAIFTDNSEQADFHNFEMEDYSAAVGEMVLAVTALGYVTVWLDSPYFNQKNQEAALKVLGVPDGYTLRVVLPIGLPDGVGSRRDRMPFNERVSYGRFGQSREEDIK